MAVVDQIHDTGGEVFDVKAYGAKGDTREVAGTSISSGSTSLNAAAASFSSADTGRRVMVRGAGPGGSALSTTATYVSATQLTLATAASSSVSGVTAVIGTDDTAAIQAAVDAAHALRIAAQPPLAAQKVTNPPVEFPSGYYLISDAIDLRGFPRLVSPGRAFIQQADPAKRIFYLAYSYSAHIRGLQLLGGTRQVEWMNPNSNEASITLEDCTFQGSSDFAVWTLGSVGLTSPTASGTLSSAAVAGATSIQVTGATFTDNQVVVIQNDAGEYHATLVAGISGSTLNLHMPIPSHWTGGAQASAGKPVKQGDFHLSSNLSITRCQILQCRKALLNSCDQAVVSGPTWVSVVHDNVDDDSAVFVNLSGELVFDQMFGVPQIGSGASRRSNVRWVDQAGWGFRATNSRFGGEDAGIPVIDFFTPPPTTYPWLLTQVLIESSGCSAGGTNGDSGVMRLRRSVPQLFVYRDNVGPANSPIIRNGKGGSDPGVDLGSFFSTYIPAPGYSGPKFRLQLGPMLQLSSGGTSGIIPPELRPYADIDAARELPKGPVSATQLSGNQAMSTFRIPGDIRSLQAIVTLSTCPDVAGSASYRLTRSDLVALYTSLNGAAVTDYLASTPLFVPTPPSGSGHSAPTLVSLHFGSASSGSPTEAATTNDRLVTVVYGNCTGSTTVSLELLHGSL